MLPGCNTWSNSCHIYIPILLGKTVTVFVLFRWFCKGLAVLKSPCMDKPGMDVCRSKLDLHTSNLDLHRSRLDLCRSKEKRQIWDFGHFATGKNSSFCVQQRLWNSFFKILSFRGCHFAKNCMKIVNFTLLLGPTWVQRWTYIGPDWTHVGPALTYVDPSQVYPYCS